MHFYAEADWEMYPPRKTNALKQLGSSDVYVQAFVSCRGFLLSCAWIIGMILLCAGSAAAQLLQGTIMGNVTDSSNATIPSATVTATNEGTHFTRTSKTDSAGVYNLNDLPPGTYTVTITAPGFETYSSTGLVLVVETTLRVNAILPIGQVGQTVTVAANAVALQTDRADVNVNLSENLLTNSPVPVGRNYEALFTTLPGASPPQTANSYGTNSTRSLQYTVNGTSINQNLTFIDGAGTRNAAASNVIQYIPALQAIADVTVATNSFQADQSAGGAFVNVTIKNGTNAVHGALFEDHTDEDLQAYTWAANRSLPKLPYIFNQFGGTIGGPIKKNKLFYFASYQGNRLVQGSAVVAQVPTAAMKTGNLSASPTRIYDPMTGNANGSGRTPFAGSVIPSSRIDPGVAAMIATGAWSDPNQPGTGSFGLGNNFLCSGCQGNSSQRTDQVDSKVDWNPTEKLSMFVRFGFNNSDWQNPQIFGVLGGPAVSPANTAVGNGGSNVYNDTVSATYVFTPNLLVDGFFGLSRNDMYSNQPDRNQDLGWTLLRIPGLDTSALPPAMQLNQNGMPYMAVAGFAALGLPNSFQPQRLSDPEYNFNGNLNWGKGSHTIRAGVSGDFLNVNELQEQSSSLGALKSPADFQFQQGTTQLLGGSAGNDFNAFASLLLGLPQVAGRVYQIPDQYHVRDRSFGVYISDTWQVTRKLTASFGLRWDYFPFPTRLGTGLEIYNPLSATMSICGIGSVPTDCGITKDKQHFDPRIGLAYRVTGSTVIRAGYSKAVDPTYFLSSLTAGDLNFPYNISDIVMPPNSLSYSLTLRQGLPAEIMPNISSGTIPVPPLTGVNTYDNTNYVRGYIESFNFTVEQQFAGWLASAGYVGNRQIDPIDNLQMNWSPVNGGTAGQILNRLTGRTAFTLFMGTMGTNKYDSLQTTLRHQFKSGYQVNLAYTFSKQLGYVSPNSGTANVVIPYDFGLNYGPQPTNVPQNFSATAVAPLPFGKGRRWAQNGLASKLAGGWQISTVVSARSGLPFTATASTASLNATYSNQFADCLTPAQSTGNIYQWYNVSAFGVPSNGRFGTCGTDSLQGPGLVNADLDVARQFPITERYKLRFRTDMFNIGNTPHHVMSGTSISSSTFMTATGIANTGREGIEQRAVRFSLEVDW